MNEENISLAEAIARYLSTVPATDRQEYQKWLNRFKKWCGEDTPLNKLKAYDHVEKYGNQVLESSSGGNDVNLEPVKTFLAYAKKTKLIEENLGVHLRLKKNVKKSDGKSRKSSSQQVTLTRDGYNKLKVEHTKLVKERPKIAESIKLAAADKDVRENAPLEAAREHQGHVEARIRELEATIESANIAENGSDIDSIRTRIGCRVTVCDLSCNEQMCYVLVSTSEVDIANGKISIESPMGRALINQAKGVVVEVKAPIGILSYRIDEIRV